MAQSPDDVTLTPPKPDVDFFESLGVQPFIIAGCAGGGFMFLMLVIALVGIYCRCSTLSEYMKTSGKDTPVSKYQCY